MKKLITLLGIFMIIGTFSMNAQCLIKKWENYKYVTIGKFDNGSGSDCEAGGGGFLLLLM